MSKETITPKGRASEADIKKWKEAHKDGIYEVESEDGKHVAYFKNPTRQDVNCALGKASAEKPLAVIEDFIALTHIGGSDEMLTENAYFLGVCNAVREKMNGIPAKLKNL